MKLVMTKNNIPDLLKIFTELQIIYVYLQRATGWPNGMTKIGQYRNLQVD